MGVKAVKRVDRRNGLACGVGAPYIIKIFDDPEKNQLRYWRNL